MLQCVQCNVDRLMLYKMLNALKIAIKTYNPKISLFCSNNNTDNIRRQAGEEFRSNAPKCRARRARRARCNQR